jgi:hypothetical protein
MYRKSKIVMNDDLQKRIQDALANPQKYWRRQHTVSTMGNSDCGESAAVGDSNNRTGKSLTAPRSIVRHETAIECQPRDGTDSGKRQEAHRSRPELEANSTAAHVKIHCAQLVEARCARHSARKRQPTTQRLIVPKPPRVRHDLLDSFQTESGRSEDHVSGADPPVSSRPN